MKNAEYYEDLPELARGSLSPARAAEILRAAQADPALMRAIAAERSLESLLEHYEIEGPSPGLAARFWARFHGEDATPVVGSRRAAWGLRLAGPLAAGVLLAIGLIVFLRPDSPPPDPGQAALEQPAPAPVDPDELEELRLLADAPARNGGQRELDLEALQLLRALDDDAFLPLDRVTQPENLALINELDLLKALDRAEGRQ